MNIAARVLLGFSQALSSMRFYADGHPARDRAVLAAFEEMLELLTADPTPRFTFVEGEAVYHRQLLRELKDWEWAARFESVGVQRIEFDGNVTVEDFQRFLDDVLDRLNGQADWNSVGRQFAPTAIRYGIVEFRDGSTAPAARDLARSKMSLSLANEIEAVEWIHGEVKDQRTLPMLEAAAHSFTTSWIAAYWSALVAPAAAVSIACLSAGEPAAASCRSRTRPVPSIPGRSSTPGA